MKYMMLIVDDPGYWENLPEAEAHKQYDRIGKWWGELAGNGTIVGGHQLQPAQTATTVKVHNGAASVTDGPFSEAKETVGGYGILDVPDLDAALAVVKTWPADATLELRPVVEREDM